MYLRLILFSLFACVISFFATGQLAHFSLLDDTGVLYKNAHSIKQYERNEFIVTDADKAVFKTKKIVTVLDKEADDQLLFVETTDKFSKLEDVEIIVYNNFGLPVRTYKKKDLRQQASGEGLIDDGMYYYLKIIPNSYPITVEFNQTSKLKGIVTYPSYIIQQPGEVVKHSEHIVTVPKELNLRYFNQQTNITPSIKETAGIMTYTWQADSLSAIYKEEGTLSWYNWFPRIYIAPNKFKLDNYPGDFTSWQAFGKWYGDLGANAQDLNGNSKTTIKNMVAKANEPKEKIEILYHYLQDNFRYVSIQLGIGGWRPFPASFTDASKYGDCKGLSNYMQACLAAINIQSYQALVNAGTNGAPANPDFPVYVFNHVILCVPLNTDTIWLECTSNNTDFGILSNFTENRNALLITETGGVLVPTPRSSAKENRFGLKADVTLNGDGSGKVHTDILATGEYKSNLTNWLYNESKDDKKAAIIYQLDMPVPETFDIELPDKKRIRELVVGIDAGFAKIPAFIAGDKMFLTAQWHRLSAPAMPKKDERMQDYYFTNPFEKTDTTIYELPKGYAVESVPKSITIEFKYGNYHSAIQYNAATHKILSIASLELHRHNIPAADFLATKKFFSDVIKDQTQKIVIKKE
jgi:hypothetical protein